MERRTLCPGQRRREPLCSPDVGRREGERQVPGQRQVPAGHHPRQGTDRHGYLLAPVLLHQDQGLPAPDLLFQLSGGEPHQFEIHQQRPDHGTRRGPRRHLRPHHAGLCQLPAHLRRGPQLQRHDRLRELLVSGGYDRGQEHVVRPLADPRPERRQLRRRHGQLEEHQRTGPPLLFRPPDVQLQVEILRSGQYPPRRLLALRARLPLGHVPLGLGGLGLHRGEIHGGRPQGPRPRQAAPLLRRAGQRAHQGLLPLSGRAGQQSHDGLRRFDPDGPVGLCAGRRHRHGHHLGDHLDLRRGRRSLAVPQPPVGDRRLVLQKDARHAPASPHRPDHGPLGPLRQHRRHEHQRLGDHPRLARQHRRFQLRTHVQPFGRRFEDGLHRQQGGHLERQDHPRGRGIPIVVRLRQRGPLSDPRGGCEFGDHGFLRLPGRHPLPELRRRRPEQSAHLDGLRPPGVRLLAPALQLRRFGRSGLARHRLQPDVPGRRPAQLLSDGRDGAAAPRSVV